MIMDNSVVFQKNTIFVLVKINNYEEILLNNHSACYLYGSIGAGNNFAFFWA